MIRASTPFVVRDPLICKDYRMNRVFLSKDMAGVVNPAPRCYLRAPMYNHNNDDLFELR